MSVLLFAGFWFGLIWLALALALAVWFVSGEIRYRRRK